MVIGAPPDGIADDRHGQAGGHESTLCAERPQIEPRHPHADEEESHRRERGIYTREQQVREQQPGMPEMGQCAPPRVVGDREGLRQVVNRVDPYPGSDRGDDERQREPVRLRKAHDEQTDHEVERVEVQDHGDQTALETQTDQ